MRLLILWIILFVPATTAAQQNFASISFGGSLPMNSYSETGDLASKGYASPSGAIKFDAAFYPVSYLGIGTTASFGSNYALKDSLLNDMLGHIEQTGALDGPIPGSAGVFFGSGFWNYLNLMAGPNFTFRPTKRLYFDFRGLVGLTILIPPQQEMRLVLTDQEVRAGLSGTNLSLGYTAGMGIRYRLNTGIAVRLAADYFRSRTSMDYYFKLIENSTRDLQGVDASFAVETLELSAGLAYYF